MEARAPCTPTSVDGCEPRSESCARSVGSRPSYTLADTTPPQGGLVPAHEGSVTRRKAPSVSRARGYSLREEGAWPRWSSPRHPWT